MRHELYKTHLPANALQGLMDNFIPVIEHIFIYKRVTEFKQW